MGLQKYKLVWISYELQELLNGTDYSKPCIKGHLMLTTD